MDRFINKLKSVNETKYDKMMMPGCWEYGRPFTVNNVNWKFCGGFFVIPRKYVRIFYDHCRNVLRDFCTNPIYKLTWETNVWNIVEMCATKDDMVWYYSVHDDTIVLNIPNI